MIKDVRSLAIRGAVRRKTLLTTTLAFAGLALAGSGVSRALAQAYPSRPIRMIVPFGAGTTTDIVARVFAEAMGASLGQPMIVDNRAGAGGTMGSDAVAKAAPDGYTIVMGTVGTHAINATLFKKLPYDPLRDFAPVAFAGYTPTVLVVAADSAIKSLPDLAAMARRPGGINFASAGNGSSGHLAGEMLKSKLGGEMVHVPYKDAGQGMTDVISGQIAFMFYHPAAVMPHIKSGRLRALGVSSAKRTAALPDVPAIAEQGYPDVDLTAWFMVYAPAATPAAVLARLRSAAAQAAATPAFQEKLRAQGLDLLDMSTEQLMAFQKAELNKWGELVRRSGAQLD